MIPAEGAKAPQLCAQCQKVCYCSRDCQRANWPDHKDEYFSTHERKAQRKVARESTVRVHCTPTAPPTRPSHTLPMFSFPNTRSRALDAHYDGVAQSSAPLHLHPQVKDCEVCKCTKASQKLKSCGGCREAYYCSPEHKAQDWAMHRQTCKGEAVPSGRGSVGGEGARKPRQKIPKPKAKLNPSQKKLQVHLVEAMRCEKASDRRSEALAYRNLGRAYQALGQVKRAVEYRKKSLAIVVNIRYRDGEGALSVHLGRAYQVLGQVQRAVQYYEKGLMIARELGDRDGEFKAYCDL